MGIPVNVNVAQTTQPAVVPVQAVQQPPVGSTSKAHQQFQVQQGAVATNHVDPQPPIQTEIANNFFNDEWGQEKTDWGMQNTTFNPAQGMPFQQPVQVQQFQEPQRQVDQKVEVEEVQSQQVNQVVNEPIEPAKPARGVALSGPSKVNTWGAQNT